jgi:hypothetical protein
MASSSSSSSSNLNFSSNDDEVLYYMDQKATMLFHAGFIVCTSKDLFTTIKMEEGGGHYVDPTIGVQDVLTTLQSTPTLFKNSTNFTTTKFEDLNFHCGAYHHLPCIIYKLSPYYF